MAQNVILMLGASCFFRDAYLQARKQGYRIVAVDMRDEDYAVCKKMADVSCLASTRDMDALLEIAAREHVTGIYAGASETNMPTAIALASRLGIPFYCSGDQWAIGTNKRLFKEMCERHGIPVTRYYHVTPDNFRSMAAELPYPVVTKPVDNNGSTGITICRSAEEFLAGYGKAAENSPSGDILVEQYMPYDSVIIHYTMVNGKAYFCGISDKKSRKISEDGAPVMALQFFPGKSQNRYAETLNDKVAAMYEKEGFRDGPIWIEAFSDGNDFVFNEMGYRFGGSMTYHPVRYLTGIDQIDLMMAQTLGLSMKMEQYHEPNCRGVYCIAPLHIRPGTIRSIEGLETLRQNPNIYAVTECHVPGEIISQSGTVSQVFCYLHIACSSREDVERIIEEAVSTIDARDEQGNHMIFRINQ